MFHLFSFSFCSLRNISKGLPIRFFCLAWAGSYFLILVNSFTGLFMRILVCTYSLPFSLVVVFLSVVTYSTMFRCFQPHAVFKPQALHDYVGLQVLPRPPLPHHQAIPPPGTHFTSYTSSTAWRPQC